MIELTDLHTCLARCSPSSQRGSPRESGRDYAGSVFAMSLRMKNPTLFIGVACVALGALGASGCSSKGSPTSPSAGTAAGPTVTQSGGGSGGGATGGGGGAPAPAAATAPAERFVLIQGLVASLSGRCPQVTFTLGSAHVVADTKTFYPVGGCSGLVFAQRVDVGGILKGTTLKAAVILERNNKDGL